MEEKVARVKLNLIAFQLGCCSLITPDLHNSLNNCLSKRKYQPCIPGGIVRITAKAPNSIHRAPMATANKGIRSKNPAGWKTRVGAYLSRSSEGSPRCALLTSSVKQNKQERSRNPGGEEIRSGESGRAGSESRALRSVPECGAVPKPGEESTFSLRSLVAVGRAHNSGRKQITSGGDLSSEPRSRRTSSRDAFRRADSWREFASRHFLRSSAFNSLLCGAAFLAPPPPAPPPLPQPPSSSFFFVFPSSLWEDVPPLLCPTPATHLTGIIISHDGTTILQGLKHERDKFKGFFFKVESRIYPFNPIHGWKP